MSNSRRQIICALICLAAISVSGCATVVTGWNQKIKVSSDPQGAAVQVDGASTYLTPAKIRLKRNFDHVMVFSKEGYSTETVKIMHYISGAFCGNVFLGGPVGMALDSMSGAQFKLVPGEVNVKMKKIKGDADVQRKD